jgi:hypothetical protein
MEDHLGAAGSLARHIGLCQIPVLNLDSGEGVEIPAMSCGEVVDYPNGVALRKKSPDQVRADESGATRDEIQRHPALQ